MSMICESILQSVDNIDMTVCEAEFDVAVSLANAYQKDLMIMEACIMEADNKTSIKEKVKTAVKKFFDFIIGLFTKVKNWLGSKFNKKKLNDAADVLEKIDAANISDEEFYEALKASAQKIDTPHGEEMSRSIRDKVNDEIRRNGLKQESFIWEASMMEEIETPYGKEFSEKSKKTCRD